MNRLILATLTIILSMGCRKSKEVEPDGNVSGDFRYYEERLVVEYLENGFVVSKSGGISEDQGDSLLFTGVALGALDCEFVPRILDGLEEMQDYWSGYLVRFLPLPAEYIEKHNVITRDGATGALFGLVKASKRCPDLYPRIQTILTRWYDTVGNSLFLHPEGRNGIVTPSFKAFWKVAHGKGISDLEYAVYMGSTLFTAESIKNAKSSCYPIHLETLQHLVFEAQGRPILAADKERFCSITKDMGLYLTDWYCERNGETLLTWLKDPQSIPVNYLHQRCEWEPADGIGKFSPRVDFLTLYRHIQEGSHPWLELKNL
jgi:hypothetical protein